MNEDALRTDHSYYGTEDELDSLLEKAEYRGNLVMGETRLEALDNSLFEKLTVVDGDISPMLEADNHAIDVAVSPDDDGNIPDPEYYPQVGDTLTMTYAEEVQYIDSRTGELCTEDTPEEYIEAKLVGNYDVDYTVCALVEVPYSMSYRYYGMGYDTILSEETAKRDSSGEVVPMIYLFDTPDEASETAAEEYLANLTGSVSSPLMYESKATVRAEFSQYEQMFLLVGGVLCTIIALVGILNFFNSIMTGILSRRREFAVIQSVGMTSRQLRTMLIYEGLFYALSSVVTALILSLVLEPLLGKVLDSMYWFYDYHFTILPVLFTVPVFVILGVLIPMTLYGQAAKQSVVERLREAG
jgi:putative ABC transport system permease protein